MFGKVSFEYNIKNFYKRIFMDTGLIIFFIGASVFGVGIAVIFSVDSISGKIFGAKDKDTE